MGFLGIKNLGNGYTVAMFSVESEYEINAYRKALALDKSKCASCGAILNPSPSGMRIKVDTPNVPFFDGTTHGHMLVTCQNCGKASEITETTLTMEGAFPSIANTLRAYRETLATARASIQRPPATPVNNPSNTGNSPAVRSVPRRTTRVTIGKGGRPNGK